mgnify:CR=1 FL=1
MSRNQKGAGPIEIILILVAVGILAFVGWYVYKAGQGGSLNDGSGSNQSETVPQVNQSSDLKEAEDFVNSSDVDKQLDTSELDASLSQ